MGKSLIIILKCSKSLLIRDTLKKSEMQLHVHYDFHIMTEQTKQRNKYWKNHMRISSIAQISWWKKKILFVL